MTPSSSSSDAWAAIDECGVIAIIRGTFLDRIEAIVGQLIDGGVRAIEISLTSPDALEQIERAVAAAGSRADGGRRHGGAALRKWKRSIAAGPHLWCRPLSTKPSSAHPSIDSMLPVPGAFTPTEMTTRRSARCAGREAVSG